MLRQYLFPFVNWGMFYKAAITNIRYKTKYHFHCPAIASRHRRHGEVEESEVFLRHLSQICCIAGEIISMYLSGCFILSATTKNSNRFISMLILHTFV